MRILVYGAGVVGTVFAAGLARAGHDVTVLARGARLQEIQKHGLLVEDVVTNVRSTAPARTIDRLGEEDAYDLALITVRNDQLPMVIPVLAANTRIPTILFMLNNPSGSALWVDALGSNRALQGFPGVGGVLKDHVVRFIHIRQQPTTIGEPHGAHTARPKVLAKLMRTAGFPSRIDRDMDGWLMSHAFFVTSVCAAIYLAEGDCQRLSRDRTTVELMIDGVREGFRTVRALDHAVHPIPLRVLMTRLPRPAAVLYWRRFLSKKTAEFAFGQHARHAVGEMRALAGECRALVAKSGVDSPALRELYRAIDEYAALSQTHQA
ncbi:MAG TPA: 2-dehydropantoate 2-reductase N-terminal domain-containing protein [Terracidiphilus sp.]|jgi:2-dehydropantoate 2-reductase